MDESLRRAARAGNVRELYRLFRGDGNILRRTDEVEFTDTPLHIAAEEGCIDFAMEIMNLKPSFARKLNPEGLTPIHLAIKKGHKEMVLRFLEFDKDLVRVKGKKAKTPLHFVSKEGNGDGMLDRILEANPGCIRDVTTENQTALHIAAKHNRLDVLQVLTQKLIKANYCQDVVNRKDKDGNTALHIAARNNQPEMLKLLLNCKADKHATNQAGSKALDIAQQLNNRESISTLQDCFSPRISTFKYKLEKQSLKYVRKASSVIFQDMDRISSEDRNALLVVLGLLLTAAYQAGLTPPAGVWQGDSSSNSTSILRDNKKIYLRKPILDDQSNFLYFYIPTCVVFIVTFFLTLGLLKPFPQGFRTALEVLLAFLVICFEESILSIAPSDAANSVINSISGLVIILMMFMCIAYRVSKISLLILGCWLLPTLFWYFDVVNILGHLILGCWLFLFLYDEFWTGSIISLGYYLTIVVGAHQILQETIIVPGCWFFLSLCRFCIRWATERRNASKQSNDRCSSSPSRSWMDKHG